MFIIPCAYPACPALLRQDFSPDTGWVELPGDHLLCPDHAAAASDFRVRDEDDTARRETRPWVAHTAWWLVHNCIAHPLIGVFPRRPAFRFHDWTSRKMHGETRTS
jgi:hypothetical protein